MNRDQAEEYTQSLGQIVGGSWRQIAWAKQMGVPKALGLSVEEWVNKRLGGYVKLAVDDRRKAVEELAADGESQRSTAEILGVDASTVNRDLNPVANATVDTEKTAENSQLLPDPVANATVEPVDGLAALAIENVPDKKTAHVSNNSGENEWYTPKPLLDAARKTMGSIDLDPASSEIANKTVCAEYFFTKDNNGLKQEWFGNVWLNPPYAQPLIDDFSEALVQKFMTGEFGQACVLVNNATETAWFQRMLDRCSGVCFLKGRVKFLDMVGNSTGAPLQGQAVLYFGEYFGEFDAAFAGLGRCLRG